ncbi:MAG: AraC family transcriptional regulator [Bacteroidales bacterium]|nr:AraC family transcriptional regulator [Bacteroidales bacterium]
MDTIVGTAFFRAPHVFSVRGGFVFCEGEIAFIRECFPLVTDCFISIACKGGELSIKQSDKHYVLEAGEVFDNLPGREIYDAFSSIGSFTGYMLVISKDAFHSVVGNRMYPIKKTIESSPKRHLTPQMFDLLEQCFKTCTSVIELGMHDCASSVENIIRGTMIGAYSMQNICQGLNIDSRVVRMIEMIDKNCDFSLPIEYYAELIRVSPRHLSRMMKEQMGTSFSTYVRNKVLSTAKELLLNSSLSVKAISVKLGFSEMSNFSRLFKKETGHTPTEYRRMGR